MHIVKCLREKMFRKNRIPVQYLRADHAPANEDNIARVVRITEGMTVWFTSREYLDDAVVQLRDADYELEVNYEDNSFYVLSTPVPKTRTIFDVNSGRIVEI